MLSRIFFTLVLYMLIFATSPVSWAMAKRPPAPSISIPKAKIATIKKENNTLTLQDCYQFALKQSETLAMAKVDIEKSWAYFLKASGEVIGEGNFVITDSMQDPQKSGGDVSASGSSALRHETRVRKFVFHQPLFQGLKSLGAFKGAGSLRSQAVNEKKRAEELLFRDVIYAFYNVLKYQKDIKITKEVLKSLNDRVNDLKQREEIGKSRESEVVTAESRVNTNEANLAELNGSLEMEKRILEFLIGKSLNEIKLSDTLSEVPPPDQLERYLPMAESRADVQASEASMKSYQQNVVVTQSKLWPNLSLDADTYEKREGFQSPISWDLLLTLNVPLYTGGEYLGNLKAAWSDYKKSKLNYQKQKRQAEMEIKQAHDAWFASFTEYKAYEKAVATAEKNYQLQKEDYGHSLVNNLDVLVALESLNQSRLNTNQALYRLKQNYLNFEVVTGVCCDPI